MFSLLKLCALQFRPGFAPPGVPPPGVSQFSYPLCFACHLPLYPACFCARELEVWEQYQASSLSVVVKQSLSNSKTTLLLHALSMSSMYMSLIYALLSCSSVHRQDNSKASSLQDPTKASLDSIRGRHNKQEELSHAFLQLSTKVNQSRFWRLSRAWSRL